MKAKWDRRDQKQKNKKKFKDYTNNVKSVTLLADIILDGKRWEERIGINATIVVHNFWMEKRWEEKIGIPAMTVVEK